MPVYEYHCTCGWKGDLILAIEDRDKGHCASCLRAAERQLAAPMGKMAGRTAKGGGADRLMAESLGCKIHELPPSLRTPQENCNA